MRWDSGMEISADLGMPQNGEVGKWGWPPTGRKDQQGSFLSGDGLRYGSRWDHVQQVLPLPVC